jgi:hypothetical protein
MVVSSLRIASIFIQIGASGLFGVLNVEIMVKILIAGAIARI